jgi:hypothetical protein
MGSSWSHARPIVGAGSARPKLLLLNSGVLLMSGGRLGNSANNCDLSRGDHCARIVGNEDYYLWVSQDGRGRSWTRHSISGWHNLMEPNKLLHYPSSINSTKCVATPRLLYRAFLRNLSSITTDLTGVGVAGIWVGMVLLATVRVGPQTTTVQSYQSATQGFFTSTSCAPTTLGRGQRFHQAHHPHYHRSHSSAAQCHVHGWQTVRSAMCLRWKSR